MAREQASEELSLLFVVATRSNSPQIKTRFNRSINTAIKAALANGFASRIIGIPPATSDALFVFPLIRIIARRRKSEFPSLDSKCYDIAGQQLHRFCDTPVGVSAGVKLTPLAEVKLTP